ncbi:MAG: hypothetical protein WBB89_10395 [Candidatus Acidiferrum sp.]
MSQSNLASAPRNMNGEDARRSTRIDRSIPLIIFGQNRMGEPFVERTVSTSLNLHGCRYPSRHDYGVGTWVTMQVVGLNVEPKPPSMRAKVKSIHVSHSARELQQVGVELETPGNVWGIAVPPQDWLSAGKMSATMPQFGTAVAPARMPSEMAVSPDEASARPEPRMADVATFPSPSPPASESPVGAETETAKPRRVVITPDGLVAALQGKLRQAAESAARAAVAKQVDEAVRQALCKIDDVRLSSIREIEELFPARIQSLKLPSKDDLAAEIASHWKEQMEMYRGQAEELAQRLEKQAADLRRELAKSQEFVDKMSREIEPQIHAKMNEAVTQAANEFAGATARAVERRYEQMLAGTHAVTQEALLKLDARSAEVQALVQSAVNAALGAFQRQSEMQVSMALAETRERAVATLSSLDAESRTACDARRQAIETDVARAAERSTDQFRKSMKAFLYSCLVAAVSAVDEHSKSTLDGLLKDNGKTLHEGNGETHSDDDTPIIPDPDIDPLTH